MADDRKNGQTVIGAWSFYDLGSLISALASAQEVASLGGFEPVFVSCDNRFDTIDTRSTLRLIQRHIGPRGIVHVELNPDD